MEMIEVEAFMAVAEAGTLTRAAAVLHLSQPAVSRRIDLLERELGAPLFERLHAGIRLTEAGRAFLPFAQQVLGAVRDGAAAVRGVQHEDGGSVTLALVGTLANARVTAQLRAFRADHPRVRLLLRTARSDEVSAMVRRGDADLGARHFVDPAQDVRSHVALHEQVAPVCATDSRLVPPEVSTVAQLAGAPWVAFPEGGGSGDLYTRITQLQLQRCGLGDAEIVAIDSLTAQKRLIEADFGLGLLPLSSIEEELRTGSLRRLPLPELETSIPVAIIHRRSAYLSGAARRLLAVLTDEG